MIRFSAQPCRSTEPIGKGYKFKTSHSTNQYNMQIHTVHKQAKNFFLDTSVLLLKTPLVKFTRNYIRDTDGVFSISSLVKRSMCFVDTCMIETYSGLPRQSSATFGNLRKMFGNARLAFGTILKNLCKSSESGRKSSENRQKRRHQYVFMIERAF